MGYVKRRTRPAPGSIPHLLEMADREVRFYREIAPEVGVRVPGLNACSAEVDEVWIDLEDLSSWSEGGDPVAIAAVLKDLHRRWEGVADDRWPWLNRAGRAAEEIGRLFDMVWHDLRSRNDVTPVVRELGDSLRGRVADLERGESATTPRTLIHGDASTKNVRTSGTGSVVLLDWEDVRTAHGEVDLTWLLVSSVEPAAWDAVIDAYEPRHDRMLASLPANAAQGILSLSDAEPGSGEAHGWIRRLEATASLLRRSHQDRHQGPATS